MTVYAQGVDYAFSHPTIASLTAAGKTFAVRYLYPASQQGGTKNLTLAEADALLAAGIGVVSNFESWAGRAKEGYAAGVEDAKAAQAQHAACGGPPGRPIYFSVDFQPTSAELAAVAQYFRGVISVIGLARTGAYGSYMVIKYLFDNQLITWGWQTYAWSAGQYDERCQLAQDKNGVPMGGADVDLDSAHAADYGQWGYKKEEVDMIEADFVRIGAMIDHRLVRLVAWLTRGDGGAYINNSWDIPAAAPFAAATDAWGFFDDPATVTLNELRAAVDTVEPSLAALKTAVAAIPTVPVDQAALERAVVAAVEQALAGGVPVGTVKAEVTAALAEATIPVTLTGNAGVPPVVTP